MLILEKKKTMSLFLPLLKPGEGGVGTCYILHLCLGKTFPCPGLADKIYLVVEPDWILYRDLSLFRDSKSVNISMNLLLFALLSLHSKGP